MGLPELTSGPAKAGSPTETTDGLKSPSNNHLNNLPRHQRHDPKPLVRRLTATSCDEILFALRSQLWENARP